MARVSSKAAVFRKLALSFDNTEERSHMDHPDFRVAGKIFATLNHDETLGMVKLTPDQQEVYLHDYPNVFKPVNGTWGLKGATYIQLSAARKEILQNALFAAWKNTAPKC
jgi:hypothetical protein